MKTKLDKWAEQESTISLKQAFSVLVCSWVFTLSTYYSNQDNGDWSIYKVYTLGGIPFGIFLLVAMHYYYPRK